MTLWDLTGCFEFSLLTGLGVETCRVQIRTAQVRAKLPQQHGRQGGGAGNAASKIGIATLHSLAVTVKFAFPTQGRATCHPRQTRLGLLRFPLRMRVPCVQPCAAYGKSQAL